MWARIANPRYRILFYTGYIYKKFRLACTVDDFLVYDLENNYKTKNDLKDEDFLIVDDKGVTRCLSEDTIKLFEKVDRPYYIGVKVED